MQGGGGNDTFVLRKGQTHGEVIADFAGNGGAAGDQLLLIGWGAGASITTLGCSNWLINQHARQRVLLAAPTAPPSTPPTSGSASGETPP